MNEYQSEEYRGYTIKLFYDDDAESPRTWDNLGTIYSNSRSYDPDKRSIEEIMNEDESGLNKEFMDTHIWLKIWGYQHSGLTISTSRSGQYADHWDSGLFGIIAISKADAIKNWGKKICTAKVREMALQCLEGEIETLDQYYTGQVYGFMTYDEDGDSIDSCWGFFGDEGIKMALEDAKGVIDAEIEHREKLHNDRIEKVKVNILLLMGNTFIYGLDSFRVQGDKLFGMPTIEKATQQQGRLREEYYNTINLADLPEPVLEDMANLIR